MSTLTAFIAGAAVAAGLLWLYAAYKSYQVGDLPGEGDEVLPTRPIVKRSKIKAVYDKSLGCTVLEVQK